MNIRSAFKWSFVGKATGRGTNLVATMVLARILDVSDYGVVALAMLVLDFGQPLVSEGIASFLVQRTTITRRLTYTSFWLSLGLAGVISSLVILASATAFIITRSIEPPASSDVTPSVYATPDFLGVISAIALILLVTPWIGIPTALLRRDMKFKAIARRDITSAIVGAVFGIATAFAGGGIWSLVTMNLTAKLTSAVMLTVAASWRPRLVYSRRSAKEIFQFSKSVCGTGLLGVVNRRIDDFLVGVFLGPVALGYYTVAYRLFKQSTNLLLQSGSMVLLPALAKRRAEPEQVASLYLKVVKSSATLAFPIMLLMQIIAYDFIALILSQKWLPSVPVFRLLLVAGLAQTLGHFNGVSLLSIGHPEKQLRITLINTTSNIFAFAIGIPFGLIGVASAFAVRAFLILPLSTAIVKSMIQFSWKDYLVGLRGPLLAGASATLASWCCYLAVYAHLSHTLRILVASFLFGTVYIAILRFVDRQGFQYALQLLTKGEPKQRRQAQSEQVTCRDHAMAQSYRETNAPSPIEHANKS